MSKEEQEDDGWETVSEHTVASDEEEGEEQPVARPEGPKSKKQGAAAPPTTAPPPPAADKKKKGAANSANGHVPPVPAAAGGAAGEEIVPEAEDLLKFIKEQLSLNPELGKARVLQATAQAHPEWKVGEKRVQKMLADIKAGSTDSVKAVDLQPLELDGDGRIAGIDGMNFGFRSFHDAFEFEEGALDKMIADCKVGCRAQSFWLSASAEPRFTLERMARHVFDLHTKGLTKPFDPTKSGAEWWVHFRGPSERDGEAIGFHWDRDETYADVTRQNVHPHVATVTYLSEQGAPTMILEQLPIPSGQSKVETAYLSHPKLGKHASFDGRLLHGVPPELMAPHATKKGYTRITFLVNIWVNHIPTATDAFPAQDVGKFVNPEVKCNLLGKDESSKATIKTSATSRVRGFAFGNVGEEHELWVPQAQHPSPFCDSIVVEYNPKCLAKVVRVGGAGAAGGRKKKK